MVLLVTAKYIGHATCEAFCNDKTTSSTSWGKRTATGAGATYTCNCVFPKDVTNKQKLTANTITGSQTTAHLKGSCAALGKGSKWLSPFYLIHAPILHLLWNLELVSISSLWSSLNRT
jgi:hypothetical protein